MHIWSVSCWGCGCQFQKIKKKSLLIEYFDKYELTIKLVPFISYGLLIFSPCHVVLHTIAHVNSAEEAGECSVCHCGAAQSLCAVASVKSPSWGVTPADGNCPVCCFCSPPRRAPQWQHWLKLVQFLTFPSQNSVLCAQVRTSRHYSSIDYERNESIFKLRSCSRWYRVQLQTFITVALCHPACFTDG